jgi:hypothetical protein
VSTLNASLTMQLPYHQDRTTASPLSVMPNPAVGQFGEQLKEANFLWPRVAACFVAGVLGLGVVEYVLSFIFGDSAQRA